MHVRRRGATRPRAGAVSRRPGWVVPEHEARAMLSSAFPSSIMRAATMRSRIRIGIFGSTSRYWPTDGALRSAGRKGLRRLGRRPVSVRGAWCEPGGAGRRHAELEGGIEEIGAPSSAGTPCIRREGRLVPTGSGRGQLRFGAVPARPSRAGVTPINPCSTSVGGLRRCVSCSHA
jgi:hypothetical protein